MKTVIVAISASLPPASSSVLPSAAKMARTWPSKSPVKGLPAASTETVWPARKTIVPPWVMTAGEEARVCGTSRLMKRRECGIGGSSLWFCFARRSRAGFARELCYGLRPVHPVVDQVAHDRRIGQGRDIAELIMLVGGDLPEDAAHDLARARLGQSRRPLDEIGRGDRPNLLPHPLVQLLAQLLAWL